MKRRKIDKLNFELLNQNDFELYLYLEKKLFPYFKMLLHFVETKNLPFTLMVLKTSKICIDEIKKNIRSYDLVFELPNKQNYYLIILQATDIKNAVEIGSRLSSLIKREFLINKDVIYNQIALISVENPTKFEEIMYQILISMDDEIIDKSEKNLWKKIIRFSNDT